MHLFKKCLAIFMATTTVLSMNTFVFAEPKDNTDLGLNVTSNTYEVEDVNKDGNVNLADALLIYFHLIGRTELTAEQKIDCDVNIDGIVDANDLHSVMEVVKANFYGR